MMQPRWIDDDAAAGINRLIKPTSTVLNADAVQAAVYRPQHRLHYQSHADAAQLAAAYLFGLAKAHGFQDGNKRTAWVAARVFLRKNRITLDFDDHNPDDLKSAEDMIVGVADSTLFEDDAAAWFRARIKPQRIWT